MKIFNIAEKIKTAATSAKADKMIMVSVEKLHFDKDYKAVFKQEEDKVQRIADDMKANGFDKSQPIIVDKDFSILDGNSRFMACEIAGITKVPVIIKEFDSKKDALLYELNLQMNRRNIKEDSVLIETYNTLASITDENGNKLFTDVEIAEKLGVSPRQISKAKEVDLKASDEIKEALSSGEITLNKAYNQMKDEEKGDAVADEVTENVSPVETSESVVADVVTESESENAESESEEPNCDSNPGTAVYKEPKKKDYERVILKFSLSDFDVLKTLADEKSQSVAELILDITKEFLDCRKSA